MGGGVVSRGVQSGPPSGHMEMCIFPANYVILAQGRVYRAKVIHIIHSDSRSPGLRPGIKSDERFFATPVWASAG